MIYLLSTTHRVYDLNDSGFEEVNYWENEVKITALDEVEAVKSYTKYLCVQYKPSNIELNDDGIIQLSFDYLDDEGTERVEVVEIDIYEVRKINELKVSREEFLSRF
jgi:hypothetical protein